jgi:hypothetical protein
MSFETPGEKYCMLGVRLEVLAVSGEGSEIIYTGNLLSLGNT